MIPSVWKTIKSTTVENQSPTIYALTEAFMQIKNKFEREMRASKLPVKPFVFRSLINASDSSIVSEEDYLLIKKATEIVFNSSEIIPYNDLKEYGEENNIKYDFTNKFKVNLYLSDTKQTNISMIDLNLQIWALLRLILRDEVKVFVRISEGEDDIPLFIDEFEVSPTIIIDPLITPIGGYLETVETNNSMPIHIDWGTVGDEKEHVLRVNTSFYARSDTPPLEVFKSDLVKELDNAENNNEACNQIVYAIKNNDFDLFKVVLETYPNFDINVKTAEGKAAIHYAASVGSIDIMKALIDTKADVNILSYTNDTALHEAIKSEHSSKELCELLIKNGADITIKNSDNETPLDLAKRIKPSFVELLSLPPFIKGD